MRGAVVLITGLGGPLGVSILKALRLSQANLRFIGTDIDALSVGLYRVDKAYVVPRALEDRDEYLKMMKKICQMESVDAVFLGSDAELLTFSEFKEQFEGETGSIVMCPRKAILDIAMDKWKTFIFLRDHGFPCPDSILPSTFGELEKFVDLHGFPLIVKPRHGSGAKNLFRVQNWNELKFFVEYVKEPVIQEYLWPDDEEYTIGTFTNGSRSCKGVIILKRVLAAGLSYKTIVVEDEEIAELARATVEKLGIEGPCNLQMRRTAQGPKIFEINPRFSSTTVIRAYFGFNEPEMALKSFVWKQPIDDPVIKKGLGLRYWDEIYVPADEYLELSAHGSIENPRSIRVDNI